GRLEAWFESVQGNDPCDCGCGCGGAEVFSFVTVDTSTQGTIVNGVRYPSSGDAGGPDLTIRNGSNLGPANSALVVTMSVHSLDGDDLSGDDDLGTATATYSIDNLWGLLDVQQHHSRNGDDTQVATFNIRNHFDFDASEFRRALWWSFRNFQTPELTYNQYAAAFDDVGPDEGPEHPFNQLYYNIAFKTIA